MGLTPEETKELLEMETGDPLEGFTRTERLMLRQLVGDRVADRFRMAQKAAESMDIVLLKGCVDELVRLDEMAAKLNTEEWHGKGR